MMLVARRNADAQREAMVERIRQEMSRRGWSKNRLATETNSEASSVTKWLEHGAALDVISLERIADRFGWTLDQLRGRQPPIVHPENEFLLQPPERRMILAFRSASRRLQKAVVELVDALVAEGE